MQDPLAPTTGALPRLALAGGLMAVIWLAVAWAMR
jgi:hypothetical protein